MGNSIGGDRLLFERVIDGEEGIHVGVSGTEIPGNPLSKQKLCINYDTPKKLNFFVKSQDNLTYEFEDDITLRFYKNNKGDVLYNLIYPEKNINKTKIMNEFVIKNFAKIEFQSEELDQIYNMVKPA